MKVKYAGDKLASLAAENEVVVSGFHELAAAIVDQLCKRLKKDFFLSTHKNKIALTSMLIGITCGLLSLF